MGKDQSYGKPTKEKKTSRAFGPLGASVLPRSAPSVPGFPTCVPCVKNLALWHLAYLQSELEVKNAEARPAFGTPTRVLFASPSIVSKKKKINKGRERTKMGCWICFFHIQTVSLPYSGTSLTAVIMKGVA